MMQKNQITTRIARCKGSNRLGASCLKTEAQPASETYYLGVYMSHDGQSPNEEDCIRMIRKSVRILMFSIALTGYLKY